MLLKQGESVPTVRGAGARSLLDCSNNILVVAFQLVCQGVARDVVF